MRIVHVVRQFYPAIGGFESVVLELARRQVAEGNAVRVVTLDRLFKAKDGARLAAREMHDGIEIVRIPFIGSSRYPIAPSVLKHVRAADIVHVHAIDFFFDFLSWTRLLHKRRLVVSTHGGFFHTEFAARLKRIYFATVTRASMLGYDGVAAVSLADQSQFAGIRPRGLVCIENGVNTRKFAEASSKSPVKSIVWIGRFSRNKRLDRLIAFFAALAKADPEWRLTIAGQPWDLGLDEVFALAREYGVAQPLTVVCAPTDAEIAEIMGNCSVIASASDYEGFGLAAIEGLSAGLYPLLSDIAPFERLAANCQIGLIVDFDEPERAAATFLERWADVSEDYDRLRGLAMAAAGRFNWDHVAGRYQRLYDHARGVRTRTILDVPVFVGTRNEAVERIEAAYAGKMPGLVAFANANALNVAAVDDKFCRVLKESLVMNDGIGVDAASRILFGASFPHNLNGTDFTPYYFKHTRHNHRIFFLGRSSGVAERAAAKLSAICGRHQIAGCQNGYARAGDTMGIIAKIVASNADVVLVAMGNPRQEMWLAEHLGATGCKLGFAVGALFDFLSGDATRAPQWVRSARLEWAYRLLREPSRLWRRYVLGNPLFLMRVLGQWWSGARV